MYAEMKREWEETAEACCKLLPQIPDSTRGQLK